MKPLTEEPRPRQGRSGNGCSLKGAEATAAKHVPAPVSRLQQVAVDRFGMGTEQAALGASVQASHRRSDPQDRLPVKFWRVAMQLHKLYVDSCAVDR